MTRFCILALAASLLVTGCAPQPQSAKALARMVFFDVGKADAILIHTQNSSVLIDAGYDDDGAELVEMLKAQGVSRLDAMIITHFDKDHVGGADAVLDALPVGKAYHPSYEKDSKQHSQYLDALERAGLTPDVLSQNAHFTLDGVTYAIDVANARDYGEDEENDFSLVVRLTAGECSALLAGDAENPRLRELLEEGGVACDILKVPHHGVYEKLSPDFFSAASPQWAVVTSSFEEMEQPDTVRALEAVGAKVLLTREGAVTCETEGKTWLVSQEQPLVRAGLAGRLTAKN